MGCPKCQCEEISASGMCLWCGYQVIEPTEEPEPNPQEHPDSSAASQSAPEELPEWRQQLSQRLQSIKQKREVAGALQEETEPLAAGDSTASKPRKPLEPAQSAAQAKPVDSRNAEKRIDRMTSRQSQEKDAPFKSMLNRIQAPAHSDLNKGPMMLLSRTLSGVVDLAVIGLSTGILLVAADIISGIRMLGFGSMANYAVLFLLIYFLYSLFFFRISSQTIGMMMTNLRLVTIAGPENPRVGRILVRCVAYLLSLFFLGIGLLWAFFDQDHLCFHDRLTNTRIVRLP